MAQKLGNILTGSRLAEFDKIFNKCMACEETDNGLPTLIIGLTKAKDCIDNFDILRKDYPEQNKWWTYAKTEKRSDYLNDLARFHQFCIRREVESVEYEYVDFTSFPLSRIKKFVAYILKSSDPKLCLLTKDSKFIFIYSRRYRKTWGLSLTLCEYVGIDRHKVVERIKQNRYNRFPKAYSTLSTDTKRIVGDNVHAILPLFDALDG